MPALGALVRVSIHRARPLPFLGLRLLPHHRRRLLYPIWYFDAIENLEGPLRGCLPGRGGVPPGARLPPCRGPDALRGERPFLFLRKKKRSFTPKNKRGPVSGAFGGDYGGLRLSYDIEDPFRPLRPAVEEQGQTDVLTTRRLRVPLSRQSAAVVLLRRGALLPLWGATPPARLTQALPPPPQARHLTTSALRVEAPGGRRIEPKTIPVPPWDGRNGRGWSSPQCVKTQAAVFPAATPRRPDPIFS